MKFRACLGDRHCGAGARSIRNHQPLNAQRSPGQASEQYTGDEAVASAMSALRVQCWRCLPFVVLRDFLHDPSPRGRGNNVIGRSPPVHYTMQFAIATNTQNHSATLKENLILPLAPILSLHGVRFLVSMPQNDGDCYPGTLCQLTSPYSFQP